MPTTLRTSWIALRARLLLQKTLLSMLSEGSLFLLQTWLSRGKKKTLIFNFHFSIFFSTIFIWTAGIGLGTLRTQCKGGVTNSVRPETQDWDGKRLSDHRSQERAESFGFSSPTRLLPLDVQFLDNAHPRPGSRPHWSGGQLPHSYARSCSTSETFKGAHPKRKKKTICKSLNKARFVSIISSLECSNHYAISYSRLFKSWYSSYWFWSQGHANPWS